MKRYVLVACLATVALGSSAMPAAAHHMTVSPHGNDKVIETWVGTGMAWETPAVEAVPDPMTTLFQPHARGLVSACESSRGSEVVFIGAPWNELNDCKHFGT